MVQEAKVPMQNVTFHVQSQNLFGGPFFSCWLHLKIQAKFTTSTEYKSSQGQLIEETLVTLFFC